MGLDGLGYARSNKVKASRIDLESERKMRDKEVELIKLKAREGSKAGSLIKKRRIYWTRRTTHACSRKKSL